MRTSMSDRSRHRLRTTTTILATALVIAPATALATHGFDDVDDSDFYHAAVDWMKDNGVTVGCNPPDNTRYCPEDSVTRGEMAVFLERLDSQDVFLRPGEVQLEGGDADTLDGKDSTAFLESSGETVFQLRDWDLNSPGELTFVETLNQFRITPGSTSTAFVYAHPDLPKQFFGVTMAVTKVDLCYSTSFGGTVTDVQPAVLAEDGDASGAFVATAFDSTDRTGSACRTYSFNAPVPLTTDRYFSVGVGVDVSSTNARVHLTRATVTLVPA